MKASANLDLLRAIAVLLVVSSHLGLAVGYEFQVLGRVGVAIFFVHTSLVLMQSLERTGPSAVPFFIRRFFRIYPLALTIVGLIAIGHALGGTALRPGELASNLLLAMNLTGDKPVLGPLWSLPYEVQMYLFLPLLFVFLQRSGVRRIAVLWVGFVGLVLLLWSCGASAQLVQYVPCFLPGVLAYVLPRRPSISPAVLFSLVGAGAAAICWLAFDGVPQVPLLWTLCLLVGVTIPQCREIPTDWLASCAKTIAKYSYSIYLTHLFAINAGFWLMPDAPIAIKLALAGLMIAAWARVVYRWIEAPGIALGLRLAARYSASISAPRPAASNPAASSAATPPVVRELVKSTSSAALSSSR